MEGGKIKKNLQFTGSQAPYLTEALLKPVQLRKLIIHRGGEANLKCLKRSY